MQMGKNFFSLFIVAPASSCLAGFFFALFLRRRKSRIKKIFASMISILHRESISIHTGRRGEQRAHLAVGKRFFFGFLLVMRREKQKA
jgi:hypothetical protein